MAQRTDDYGIQLIVAGQAQPQVTFAETVRALQAMFAPAIDILNDPPVSPTNGDVYIAGDTPTGAWSEWANKVVHYYGGTWYAVPDVDDLGDDIAIGARQFGLRKFVQYYGTHFLWDGSAWVLDA